MVVPPEYTAIAAYICGWCNFIGNAAGDASFANGFASFLSASLVASGYAPFDYQQQVGISIGILFLWTILNFFRIDRVGWVNNLAAFCHCASIVVIVISVLCLSKPLASGMFVFTNYNNTTGFSSKSYVACLGITVALFDFSG